MSLVKQNWTGTPNAVAFDSGQVLEFANVATIGANVSNSTVQARILLPVACKIPIVAVSYSAIAALTGHLFNIAVGAGAYLAGETYATQTFTVGGTPTTSDTATATINGNDVTAGTITTGDTVTQVAAALASRINADTTVNLLVSATSSLGVVTVTAKSAGVAGNAITTTAAATGGHTTLTAGNTTLLGGVAETINTVPPTDNSLTGPLPGGAGYPTVFASAGDTLFAADKLISATAGVGVAASTFEPALAAPTTAGGVLRFIPDVPDAVYPAGTLLTLRVVTPASTGSITDFKVSTFAIPVRTKQAVSQTAYLVAPGVDY